MKAVTKVADQERHVISEYMVIFKFLLVNPARIATGGRAFVIPKRVKTWLRADINQQKFYHVIILETNLTSTDKIWLVHVNYANDVA